MKVKVATTLIDSEGGQFTENALKSQDGIEVPVGITFDPDKTPIGTATLEYSNGELWANVGWGDLNIELIKGLYIVPMFVRSDESLDLENGVVIDDKITILSLGMTASPCDLNLTTIEDGIL